MMDRLPYPALGSAAVLRHRNGGMHPAKVVSVVQEKMLVVVEDASGCNLGYRPYYNGESFEWTHVKRTPTGRWIRTWSGTGVEFKSD
jgi:hypothetical protein